MTNRAKSCMDIQQYDYKVDLRRSVHGARRGASVVQQPGIFSIISTVCTPQTTAGVTNQTTCKSPSPSLLRLYRLPESHHYAWWELPVLRRCGSTVGGKYSHPPSAMCWTNVFASDSSQLVISIIGEIL